VIIVNFKLDRLIYTDTIHNSINWSFSWLTHAWF